jgi:serine/threonine protein kinase
MEARPAPHPSSDILRAFGSGQLDDATAEMVVAHLETCPSCSAKAAGMSGDGFLKRLRAARRSPPAEPEAHGSAEPPSGTPPPGLPPTIAYQAPAEPAARAADPYATVYPESFAVPDLRSLPQYEVIRELGRGGMGVVYLAKNKLMARREVLKVVNTQLLDHPDVAARFLREICSAANLNHPNIVIAYAALQIGKLVALAMEYVEGEDLAKVVQGRGALPVANACDYAQQTALGLQHACDKGMVHRDIKPQNLILAQDGNRHIVKILDFGLAKATCEKAGASRTLLEANRKLTKLGAMMGSPQYIAPEQIMDAARADIRADIYSLGCTLYFLLTGRPPFQRKTLDELLQAHWAAEATALNQVRGEVPAELAAIVGRMMAKDPAKRYQQPVEVAQALAQFVKTGPPPLPAKAGAKAEIKPEGVGPAAAPVPGIAKTMIEDRAAIAQARPPRPGPAATKR